MLSHVFHTFLVGHSTSSCMLWRTQWKLSFLLIHFTIASIAIAFCRMAFPLAFYMGSVLSSTASSVAGSLLSKLRFRVALTPLTPAQDLNLMLQMTYTDPCFPSNLGGFDMYKMSLLLILLSTMSSWSKPLPQTKYSSMLEVNSQEGQYQQIGCWTPFRRIYEMMIVIRSTELVLIEIMSVLFCYPCSSTRDALHSKILFSKM